MARKEKPHVNSKYGGQRQLFKNCCCLRWQGTTIAELIIPENRHSYSNKFQDPNCDILSMQHSDSSLHQYLIQGWQILGNLELTVGPATDQTVNKWLKVILSQLELHADFAAKVFKSAQEATSRAMQAENIVKSQHIHLLILFLADYESKKQNWGFFRIEKIRDESDQVAPDHTIEFYLYQEG